MSHVGKVVGLGVMLSVVACAGGMSGRDGEQQQAFEAARKERQELLGKVRGATPDQANRCEVSDGDCLILVGERREALFPPSAACEGRADVYEREECQANALAKEGKLAEVTDFYQYENWCFAKLVACGERGEQEATEKERQARLDERRQALLQSTDVDKLALEIAFARERVNYLRATVPQDKDAACANLSAVSSCREQAKQSTKKLEQELDKDDRAYDSKLAAELFQSEMTAQASCFQPEFDCLSEHLKGAGENKESKRHLTRNLKLIEERETLAAGLPPNVVQECTAAAQADYGDKIAKSYERYSKKPNTLFRVFLHQAYVKLHGAEVKCLKQHKG